jgi:hypothetical protein
MTAALSGAHVSDVQVALVDHFDVDCSETLAQLRFDPRAPVGSIGHGAGGSWLIDQRS